MSEIQPQTGSPPRRLTSIQLFVLAFLRMAIGWHFLYEGLTKLLDPGWTSRGYLESSRWILADAFQWIVANETVLRIVDLANIWGLVLIGAGLMLGFLTRIASVCGILLLLLYYAAHPPLFGLGSAHTEGNYLIVDKNLVELFALVVVAFFPTGRFVGLDRFVFGPGRGSRRAAREQQLAEVPVETGSAPTSMQRRELLFSLAAAPVIGGFVVALLKKRGWLSFEEENLKDRGLVDATTSATIKTFKFTKLEELKAKVPHAKIGNKEFSKLILGGNLIGGWAHARDLIYVSKLVKAYHSDPKVFETLNLAEQCGINAILTNPILCRVIGEYWKHGGRIQFISDCGGADLLERVQMSIDNGAAACYVQGETADALVRDGKTDLIAKALELIRKNDQPAGIGAHRIETIQACVQLGLQPDFWMKTLHHVNYWSAQPSQENDNIFDRKPQDTVAFMKDLPQPWIAFKTLAAGAIDPREGFRFALENGADFLCVGMYDFQIVDDVNIYHEVAASDLKRERPWRAG